MNVLFPSGAAMLVRKHEFLAMGGFDPLMFMYHEDVDLGWRYWLRGQRVVMCPRSVVFHAFGGTTGVEHGVPGATSWAIGITSARSGRTTT
ncbi:MAG: glycosyltransferase [Burkholderiaceae bacterium]|nr:MAG: glycosyltransferase [Burkholderiaceae bacterium]